LFITIIEIDHIINLNTDVKSCTLVGTKLEKAVMGMSNMLLTKKRLQPRTAIMAAEDAKKEEKKE
jgi:hypothetical protein